MIKNREHGNSINDPLYMQTKIGVALSPSRTKFDRPGLHVSSLPSLRAFCEKRFSKAMGNPLDLR